MYRTLGITAFSLVVATLLFSSSADDSLRQVDPDKKSSPAIEEKVQDRIRLLRDLRRGAENRDQQAAQNHANREQDQLARKSEDDLLRRFHSGDKELGQDELREAVRILAGRVLRLEAEVRLLREAPPRLELLR